MADIKLTKNELRTQQAKLRQLQRYLPTLQLKKALLQAEVQNVRTELKEIESQKHELYEGIEGFARLFPGMDFPSIEQATKVDKVKTRYENIAGVEVPTFEDVVFHPVSYHLFDTPVWMDSAMDNIHQFIKISHQLKTEKEKLRLLMKELREVSIRVNLFEKVLIPRSISNIKKIKVFLGDQQLAAVAQAKVAKLKIEQSRMVECAST